MTVLERLAANFIWQQVRIGDMQFCFMPRPGTTDTMPILRQLQKVPCRKKTQQKAKTKTKQCTWLRRYGKGIGSCTQMCHLVSSSKPWRRGVADAPGAEHI